MRSSTPPWPGSRLPLSLRPACRLNMLSVEVADDRDQRDEHAQSQPRPERLAEQRRAPPTATSGRAEHAGRRSLPRSCPGSRAARACAGRTRGRRSTRRRRPRRSARAGTAAAAGRAARAATRCARPTPAGTSTSEAGQRRPRARPPRLRRAAPARRTRAATRARRRAGTRASQRGSRASSPAPRQRQQRCRRAYASRAGGGSQPREPGPLPGAGEDRDRDHRHAPPSGGSQSSTPMTSSREQRAP